MFRFWVLAFFAHCLFLSSTSLGLDQKKSEHDFRPLFFDPLLNGVKLPHQYIDYRLRTDGVLQFGPMEMNSFNFKMRMSRELGDYTEREFGEGLVRKVGPLYAVSFEWPLHVLPYGTIEVLDENNKSVWRKDVTQTDVRDWINFIQVERERRESKNSVIVGDGIDQKNLFRERNLEEPIDPKHWNSNYGVFGQDFFYLPVWRLKQAFRYCVSYDDGNGRLVICSPKYRMEKNIGRYELVLEGKRYKPSLLVNDKKATLKGTAIFVDNKTPLKLAAHFENGAYYEFISYPRPVHVVDLVWDKSRRLLNFVGFGDPPYGVDYEEIDLNAEKTMDFLNFKPTIGDLRKYWKTTINDSVPALYFKGYGGAIFRQGFDYKNLPEERHRIFIEKSSRTSSYTPTPDLKGSHQPGLKVSSKNVSAKSASNGEFDWTFWAPNKGEMNKSIISISEGKFEAKAFHEVYRGFPLEISARLTGVVSNTFQVVLLSEFAGQYWFDHIWGLDKRSFDRLRWGVAVKHFEAFAGIGPKEEGRDIIDLGVTTGDVKYRFDPGVWGRDPTVGLIGSYQKIKLDTFQSAMGGVGFFWARSMPEFFDEFFNIIPWLRYPKWVDLEFVFYPLPLDEMSTLNINFNINFHGKVQWTDRFYGEAGFGFKFYDFIDGRIRKRLSFGVAYGTVGIGYNF